jgi:hypothetical protein
MYTRKKPVTVEQEFYYANDGTEFSTEGACIDYERRKAGTRITCPECHGKKGFQGRWINSYDNYDIGHVEGHYEWERCTRCNGKGYLEQKWE